MGNEQQIAVVKAALAAIESAIAQTEGALRSAATHDDVLALTSALVDLRAERVRLQFQLANLEAAAVVVQPLADAAPAAARSMAPRSVKRTAARSRAAAARDRKLETLEKQLTTAVTDRTVVVATLNFATDVMKMAKTLRMIGDDVEGPKIARPIKKPAR